MIPLRLQLRNFMCYRDPAPLDLTGIHLACLAGDNGHGKSALLDAITWALWGHARARYDDELVSAGEKEMEVELEFQLGDARYRVIRKRELGRQARSSLEFQVRAVRPAGRVAGPNGDDDQFRALTAGTQRETQARIMQVLHMDYDTFINSALLLQGRADEFTVKPPAERKRILADILGLSIYDEYEQRAKELAREKEQAGREVEARIQEIERELEHRAAYEQELEVAQTELARLSGAAQAAEAALRDLRDRVKTLETQKAQALEVDKRMRTAEVQIAELDAQLEAQAQRIAANESVLARRAEIEAGFARWAQAREQEAALAAMLPQLLSLNRTRADVERRIAEAQKGLELQAHGIEQRLLDLRKTAERRARLEAEHGRVCADLAELTSQREQGEAARGRIGAWSQQSSALEALNKQLKQEMAGLKDKLDLLQQPTATCPLCGQALADDDRVRLMEQLEAEGKAKVAQYHSQQATLKELATQTSAAEEDLRRIERDLKRLPALQGHEATLAKAIQDAREAEGQLQEQEQALQALQQQVERREFAMEEQAQNAALEARIAALGYDQAAHEQARRALVDLARFEADQAQLERAQQSLGELQASRQQLSRSRETWAVALEQDHQRHAELSGALAGLSELSQQLQMQQQELDQLRSQEGHARQIVGATQQKLDYCHYLAKERKERGAQFKRLGEERGIYAELQQAFGKNGLQALIIESAIPEIEDEANRLLGRMTEGRMSVHFDTQRDTKGGSTVETLDIKIADENGPRSYELYSGGEAFRINLAVRIALSKLLARRAGARLQTLIIDEGFGTQDVEGRQKLVEAIHSIQDDFALILVITHIEELKDAFPVRIDVLKTPRGSQITIN